MRLNKYFFLLAIAFSINHSGWSQLRSALDSAWSVPREASKPWTFWYWMHGAVTKEAIKADLEAMASQGLAGAYLMPIKAPLQPPHIPDPVTQLTPAWWDMVRYSFEESKRLGLKLGMHVSDGFALAGGPWITPELSMQKLVWASKQVTGGSLYDDTLQQPETLEGFYKDVAVFAYPSPLGHGISTRTLIPKISASLQDSIAALLVRPENKTTFGCNETCWIQFEFPGSFTCRSIVIKSRNNYQANRLILQKSEDGQNFITVWRLQTPRHGWQDWDADYTHAIPAVSAKYFRLVYDKEGSEPGAEDLDAAKWRPTLRLSGIELSSEARIDAIEGKNGEVWRIAPATSEQQVPVENCVPLQKVFNLTAQYNNGKLNWQVPPGNWTILRMGHTSTGHRNETGGGGKGLECDKFNPGAVSLQFNKWFGEIYKQVDTAIVKDVLQYLHIDSWECGSQNWSEHFMDEFKKRRGYDLLPYLPVMAGIPIESAAASEKVLLHVRETIAELVNDKFYGTLAVLAKQKGVTVSAESVAPTMMSDGMLHYQTSDIPMGELWFRSPTHDKPNDMLDAISGAHIYGKNIVQAESFTELRMAWDEHPALLKTLLDRNYAMGINRIFYHVFVHNPWMDRKPGMTLDPIGLFFQRDQTWWKQGGAFIDYALRCQALLQLGKPVTDIAVFTGEDYPRRALLPDRLVTILPGLIGKKKLDLEKIRLKNEGQPLRQMPAGITHSANMADPGDWVDPLNGYAYDSYNKDALLRLSHVKNRKLQLSTGASYQLLVIPGSHSMSPSKDLLSDSSAMRIRKLVKDGATVIVPAEYGLIRKIRGNEKPVSFKGFDLIGKGRIIYGPYNRESLETFGISRDFIATGMDGKKAEGIAWTHRAGSSFDIYFISNQIDSARQINISLRVNQKLPELWDPLNGSIVNARNYRMEKGRTTLPVYLESNGSLFIVFRKTTKISKLQAGNNRNIFNPIQIIKGPWTVQFDTAGGGPLLPVKWNALQDWSKVDDSLIRYYSGTASYSNSFLYQPRQTKERIFLNVNDVSNLAEIFVNGKSCGVTWTSPYRVEITSALRKGNNEIRIEVTNTWANRMIGDALLPPEKKITYTPHSFNMKGKPLLPAGLLGPVVIERMQ